MAAQRPSFPEDSIQSLVGDWWREDAEKPSLCRGRLLWAFVPHVDQEPRTLTPEGRAQATEHERTTFKIEPLRIGQQRSAPKLPIAGLPGVEGEVHTVYRAKRRPALVLGGESTEAVDPALTRGMSKYQTAQTVLVAPYYGITGGTKRGGFNREFVDRIRRAEYPEYVWDSLPIGGNTAESLLMLKQLQPIGRHHNAYELTSYRLGDEALAVIDEWLEWLLTGRLDPDGVIEMFRSGVRALV